MAQQNSIEVGMRKYNEFPAPVTKSLIPSKIVRALTVKLNATATRVTTVATVFLRNHGFVVGDQYVITGTAPFATTATVTSVPTSDTFTYTVANSGATSASDLKVAVTVVSENLFRGQGAQSVNVQISQTLAALQALFAPGTSASLNIVGDASTDPTKFSSIAAAQPVIWPISSIIEFTGVNVRTFAITDADRALTIVTATSVGHGLSVGDEIVVSGASNAALNGTYVVATVPTANTFTYATTTSGTITDATATGTVQRTKLWVNEEGAVAKEYFVKEAYATVKTALFTP